MKIILSHIRQISLVIIFLITSFNSNVAQTSIEGDIVAVIQGIKDNMPGSDSESFVIPTDPELVVFEGVLNDLKAQNFSTIQSRVTPYNYSFYQFLDLPTNRTIYLLKENNPIQRGWGTFIFYPNATTDIAIEIPHPIWDTKTYDMGIKTFKILSAKWFIMAGTHRYANADGSSDMAHVNQSVFHKTHIVSSTETAIQVHGFDRSKPDYVDYKEVIISNGTLYPPSKLYTLKNNTISEGFSSEVFSVSTYNETWRLGATQNKQGLWSNSNGKLFVHIEYDYPIRTNTTNMNKAINAINTTFGNSTDIDNNYKPSQFMLYQNYPNPFNSTTTFKFEIPEKDFIILKIFDVTGRDISTLLAEEKDAGIYNVSFNTQLLNNELCSGIYFCNIKTSKFTSTKKIILIK